MKATVVPLSGGGGGMGGLVNWLMLVGFLLLDLVGGHVADDPSHVHYTTSTFTSTTDNLNSFYITTDANGCTTMIHEYHELLHKPRYRVGVFSSEGDDVVYELYNRVYAQYLTATAGYKFDPPIQFEVVPVSLSSAMTMALDEQIDFLFAPPSVFSCMATEQKAQALVTIINRRESRGYEYDLDVYGGVMFVLKDNHQINSILDFKDRRIGAGHITSMGGGQTQFYEMFRNELSYVADPKQIIFTNNERLVVQGVLDGDFEIGFARTDQIERHTDEEGNYLPDSTFKIINPQTHVLDDGKIFPFVSSTSLNAEWPFAALDHVDRVVSKEVQEALLAIQDHAMTFEAKGKNLRCETTPALAELAYLASSAGRFAGFRTARSYFDVRTKQEAAGFMILDESTEVSSSDFLLRCIQGQDLYKDIQCPESYYKVTRQEYDTSCERMGLDCGDFECFCQPCIKAFEVDVYQYHNGDHHPTTTDTTAFGDDDEVDNDTSNNSDEPQVGCEKMSLCGEVQQTKPITFRILDHLERHDPKVEVVMHWGPIDEIIPVMDVPSINFTYEFTWQYQQVGVGIIEIFFNNEQIPESPMRLQVTERDCDADFPGQGKVPDDGGSCVCGESTVSIGSNCVPSANLAIGLCIMALFILSIAGLFYMRYRHQKGDRVWQVNIDELHFDQPVEVIGQGSFGVVLKAEYRGTKVAIKRALKSKRTQKKSGSGHHGGFQKGLSNLNNLLHNPFQNPMHLFWNHGDEEDVVLEEDTQRGEQAMMGNSTRMGYSENRSSVQDLENQDGSTNNQGTRSLSELNPNMSIGFLEGEFGGQSNKFRKLMPWQTRTMATDTYHQSVAFSATESATAGTSVKSLLCPWFDPNFRQREEFKAEMRVLARLRHPAITTVMGAVYTTSHDPMLVMEYMEYGSLHNLLRNETMILSGEIILQMARDLAQGMRFLHTSKPPILHGDLKARNILVDNKFRAKICDFGLSTKRGDGGISGTPYWLPPEYLRGEKQYDTTCDMYSIGIILYEIFSRKTPYEGEDFRKVLRGVCNRGENKRPEIPAHTPPKFVALMKKCWSPDAHYRPRAMDLDLALIEMSPNDAELIEEDQADNKKRAGEMLNELFPKHVADQIRRGQKVEPESHELVTIIFSDIIHFTDISRTISPEKVCDMLDRLYHSFDFCARKHKVFKVETIGDAYMGVTNLEGDQNDEHVKHIAEFAVDMVNEASKILIDQDDPSRGNINIRVGFHSGPVVSNVIGSLNKRYGLFGDSVNTASRMESNSTANRILCSERSARLLKRQAPKMLVKKRGKIHVKGKGEMITYWVGDNLLNPDNEAVKPFRRSNTVAFDSEASEEFSSPEAAPSINSMKDMDGGTDSAGPAGRSAEEQLMYDFNNGRNMRASMKS